MRSAEARFKVGEITRTDVAQARAALSQSQTTYAVARSDLDTSVAEYTRVVGNAPGSLVSPGMPKGLPKSLETALAQADKLSPDVQASIYNEEASRYQIGVARKYLPDLPRNRAVHLKPGFHEDQIGAASLRGD